MPVNLSEKKSAVIFGSTGLVGKEILSQLLSNNDYDKVMAVTRKPLSISNIKLEQVLLKDFSGLKDLKDKLQASEFYCCIGTTIAVAGSKEAFRQVDLYIPQLIARIAEEMSIPSLVIISSIGANISSSNFYLRTKGEMEKTVRETYSGNLKFVRPSFLMGNRSEFRFGEKVGIGFMKTFGWLFIGSLKKYRGIDARDVASAMIKISTLPAEKLVYESDELREICKDL